MEVTIVAIGDRFGSIRAGGLTFHFDAASPHDVEVAGEVWVGAPEWCPEEYKVASDAFAAALATAGAFADWPGGPRGPLGSVDPNEDIEPIRSV